MWAADVSTHFLRDAAKTVRSGPSFPTEPFSCSEQIKTLVCCCSSHVMARLMLHDAGIWLIVFFVQDSVSIHWTHA